VWRRIAVIQRAELWQGEEIPPSLPLMVMIMAFTHNIIEVRPYLDSWLVNIEITDTDTGRIYNRRFNSDHNPSAPEQEAFAAVAKLRIQAGLDYEANDLNLTSNEDVLLEYYRGIKTDVILRIREYPGANLQQAADYISGKYPTSPLNFTELYNRWLTITDSASWSEFKQFCINHKFQGID